MASGTAYRCLQPGICVLNLYPEQSQETPPILHEILLNLDLTSIGMLRRVDTIMRRAVESLPAYSLLRALAPDTLEVIEAVKCSGYFPIRQLFAELCPPWCRTCPDFGPFLYLPTLTRSCYKCNFLRPEYQLATVGDVCWHFGLTPRDISRSAPPDHPRTRPAAPPTGRRVHGPPEAMQRAHEARIQQRYDDYTRRWEQYQQKLFEGGKSHRPWRRIVHESLLNNRAADVWRMEATVAFPYWDRQTRILEPGAYCRACTYHWEEWFADDWNPGTVSAFWNTHPPSREAAYRAFLEQDLPAHFRGCAAVKANDDFDTGEDGAYGWDGPDFVVGPRDVTAAGLK
ncbi:hypothetical protein BO71DRAFT_435165 [Aspergillus ellipticus CBS 707.79]|uniref:F-box domain-containing protein n=1 Tax=Aspergillus ellipticus CBS 707.79 TaxID=1448320 RepID=A0A319D3G6_9EURO|nr:hypothetical protein BO71DRAFT_435165 [Aspergillus ellipticus CBS 707.79]